MIAQKGSVTLDGVSLTVNGVGESGQAQISFDVNIIPHTAHCTTLGEVKRGQQLNVEIDVLARYIDRMMATSAH
jgi:riboflavin synthase